MKVKALANLSGRPGDRDAGDTFEIDDVAYVEVLVSAGLVEKVTPAAKKAAAATDAPPKA